MEEFETMNIFSAKGSKVKVTKETANNGYFPNQERVREYLELEKEYTVDRTVVNQSSTTVYLQEIENIGFNSVNFVNVGEFTIDKSSFFLRYQKGW